MSTEHYLPDPTMDSFGKPAHTTYGILASPSMPATHKEDTPMAYSRKTKKTTTLKRTAKKTAK